MDVTRHPQEYASLSIWRVWIEMPTASGKLYPNVGHSLYGECGLKLKDLEKQYEDDFGHSLYGECGLKFD